MKRASVFVSLGFAVVGACSNGHRSTGGAGSGSVVTPAAAIVVADVAAAQAAAGKQVEVHGTAGDAKLSAVVTLGTTPVYCLGLDRWPADRLDRPVVARGLLESTTEFAEESDPNLPSAGTAGAVWVLRSCTFDPAP